MDTVETVNDTSHIIAVTDDLSHIQKEVIACEKEIIWCNRMLNKEGSMPYQYVEIFSKKRYLIDRSRALKEELGIKNQLIHIYS